MKGGMEGGRVTGLASIFGGTSICCGQGGIVKGFEML